MQPSLERELQELTDMWVLLCQSGEYQLFLLNLSYMTLKPVYTLGPPSRSGVRRRTEVCVACDVQGFFLSDL